MSAGGKFEQWFAGAVGDPDPMAAMDNVAIGLQDLERILGDWYTSLAFGPIPGQYFPVQFHARDPGGLSAGHAGSQNSRVNLPFEFRPIYVSAWWIGSASTVDMNTAPTRTLGPAGATTLDSCVGLAVDTTRN